VRVLHPAAREDEGRILDRGLGPDCEPALEEETAPQARRCGDLEGRGLAGGGRPLRALAEGFEERSHGKGGQEPHDDAARDDLGRPRVVAMSRQVEMFGQIGHAGEFGGGERRPAIGSLRA
jgi:hypothetical protein